MPHVGRLSRAKRWDLRNADVFEGKTLERVAANSMIFVGNPPYENIVGRSPYTPKPVELLRRALPALPAHALVGLVLPVLFIDGNDYKREREIILNNLN